MTSQGTRMNFVALVIALVALSGIWGGADRTVLAIQDSEDMPSPISIVLGQTLQLNVANAGSGNPIRVEIMILDDRGNLLKQSRELVMPLHTAVLTLNGDEVIGTGASRLLTRAVVKVIGNPHLVIGDVVVSEEVIDNETQRTLLLHPGTSKGFNPQPDPPAVR
jgi:hypothetical protein